jgi:hypothetical protein
VDDVKLMAALCRCQLFFFVLTGDSVKLSHLAALAVLTYCSTTFATDPATPAKPDFAAPISQKDAIHGTMDIDFNTRIQLDDKGKPNAGVKDQYRMDLVVNQNRELSGSILRLPRLRGTFGNIKQPPQYEFNVDLIAVNTANPTQKKTVGKWAGWMPVDKAGVFVLDGGRNSDKEQDHALRTAVFTVGTADGFQDQFSGKLYGKAEHKEGLIAHTFSRIVNGQTVTKVVKVDPMRFEGMHLAAGPDRIYPACTVNGELDYDYELGNYIADHVQFSYTYGGIDYADVVSGTIKWIEDPQRKTNGKGHYEFNLRWNEDKNKKSGENAAFTPPPGEDAFFAVDPNMPTLTGTVDYVDTLQGDTTTASKIVYHLDSQGLTKIQVMNFAKLWVLAAGPTNDD